MLQLARYTVDNRRFGHLPWHYLIAPDGGVWRGRPLDMLAVNAPGRNRTGVGVTLVLDGSREEPTVEQARSAGIVMRALLERFQLRPADNFADGRGFHSDHVPGKQCPGALVTKPEVLDWIAAAGATSAFRFGGSAGIPD